MIATAAVRHRPAEGLTPFDPFLHLGQVAELLFQSFDRLGPGARHTMRRMQRLARRPSLSLWLWGTEVRAGMSSGFVWLEDGRVVGNISLRRAATPGGWMIGNVAVHREWRGRGIGRALMDAAISTAADHGGTWVGLEVHDDNDVARHLYAELGFESVGDQVEMTRAAGQGWPRREPLPHFLRRARAFDNVTLYHLARQGLSNALRQVLEVRRSAYRADWELLLSAWLDGCRDGWWVVQEDKTVVAALRVSSYRAARFHRLQVLARRDLMDDLGPQLVQAGMTILARRRPWETTTMLPGPRQVLEPAFVAAGFHRARRLLQMQMPLGRLKPSLR